MTEVPIRLVAAVLLMLAACSSGDTSGQVVETTVDAPATTDTPASDEPNEVAVDEAGFGWVPATHSDPFAVYAVTVSNPNVGTPWVATDVNNVVLTFRGPDGSVTAREDSKIEMILPGQQAAATGRTFNDSLSEGDVAEMDVQVRVGEWWDSESTSFGGFDVVNVNLTEDAVLGEVRSQFSEDVTDVDAHAIFRDEAGEIIGGWNASGEVDFVPAGGTTSFEIHVPGGLDPATADVIVQFGFVSSAG